MPVYTLNPSATFWVARGRDDVPHGDIPTPWPPTPGTYIPSPTTTGIRVPKSQLTVHQGDLVVTQNNRVIENLWIKGILHIRAANVTVRNCFIDGGGPAPSQTAQVVCLDARCINFVIEDSTLIPAVPHYNWTGMIGHDYTARRLHTQWNVDSFGIFNTDKPDGSPRVIIEDCYMGPLALFSPDPNHINTDNRTHNDHIQIQSGVGSASDPVAIIRRNAFWGYLAGGWKFPEKWPNFPMSTSSPLTDPPNIKANDPIKDHITAQVQITSNVRRPGESVAVGVEYVVITGNWFYGSAVGVSFAGGGPSTPPRNPGVITDNWFDGMQAQSGLGGTANAWTFSVKSPDWGDRNSSTPLLGVWTGNINAATNTPARIGRS